MRVSSFIAAAAVLVPFSGPAWPCGLCHEDNRAAVYSWKAMQKVNAAPRKLEFVVLKVKGALPPATADQLTSWIEKREGVDPATVKVSTLQKSIGFVFEKSLSKDDLLAALSQEFPKLTFQLEKKR